MHNTNLRSKESQTLMSQNVTKRYKDNIFTSMYVWHRVEVLIYAVIIIFFNILLLVTKEYRKSGNFGHGLILAYFGP